MSRRSIPRRASAALLLATLLAGCVPPPEAPPREADRTPPAELPAACRTPAEADGRLYRIDPLPSRVEIRAYRGGRLARLGHNHLVEAREIQGWVLVGAAAGASRFALCIPVAALAVDDPERRARAGGAFATPLDAAAVAGTRHNMLGEKLLDGTRHPYLIVRGSAESASGGEVPLRLTFTVRDRETTRSHTATIRIDRRTVTAHGRLTLRQSELGLQPYSALFGALLVKDALEIDYTLVARR
ncbi:MAG: hypothetical protein Kow006_11820 [Gammaproteobacteria bacterium]